MNMHLLTKKEKEKKKVKAKLVFFPLKLITHKKYPKLHTKMSSSSSC